MRGMGHGRVMGCDARCCSTPRPDRARDPQLPIPITAVDRVARERGRPTTAASLPVTRRVYLCGVCGGAEGGAAVAFQPAKKTMSGWPVNSPTHIVAQGALPTSLCESLTTDPQRRAWRPVRDTWGCVGDVPCWGLREGEEKDG